MPLDLNSVVSLLNSSEKAEIKANNLIKIEQLVEVLLKRVPAQNILNLVYMLNQAVLPSICSKKDSDLDNLFNKLKKEPKSIFNQNTQKNIEYFITNRFERDKKVIIEKTSDITKFLLLMEQFLNETMVNSGLSSKVVLNIKDRLESLKMDSSGIDALSKLQYELVNAANEMQEEMNKITNSFQSGKNQIQELEEKIKSLENELDKIKDESMIDHLTGLLMRKAYEERIKNSESSFIRYKTQYAIVFLDLDNFKQLNDTYGHEGGDVILSTFGKVLSQNTRDHDIVARYGGEEFIAIIHFEKSTELLQYLKRIKSIITENSFIYKDKKIKVTFSAGVTIRGNYNSYKDSFQKADALLYKAKASGRNKIILEDGTSL